MAVDVKTWHCTVDNYHKMGAAGIFCEDDRVELLNGEIIQMSPIGGVHQGCVKRLNRMVTRFVERDLVVGVQDPVRLSDVSEPQPDISIIRTQFELIPNTTPTAGEVVLLMEVSDTTYQFDRQHKLRTYALAGIAEYWIIDIQGGAIERHTEPADGSYHLMVRGERGQQLTSSVLPDMVLDVAEVLGQ